MSAGPLGTVFVELPSHAGEAARLLQRLATLSRADDRLVCGLVAAGSSPELARQFPSVRFLERRPDGSFDLIGSAAATPFLGYLPLGAPPSRPRWEELAAGDDIVPWVPLATLPEERMGFHPVVAGGWLASTALLSRVLPNGGPLSFATLWQMFRSKGVDLRFRAAAAAIPGTRLPDRTDHADIPIGADASVLALVPHYQCEEWLEQALASLVGQSRPLDGIVVLDDASPEPPVDIVRCFPQVTLLTAQARSGPYRLIQSAMDRAKHDAFLLQDADDWSATDRLELLLREAGRTGAELLGCQEIHVEEGTGSVRPKCYPLDVIRAHRMAPSYALLHPSSLVARSLVDRIGGYATGLRFSGDLEFLLRAAHVARIVNIDLYAYFRRGRPASLTRAAETGLQSDARAAVHDRIYERAHQNAVRVSLGAAPDLTPLARAPAVAFRHLAGPPLADGCRR